MNGDRFWNKVQRVGDGCWEWTATRDSDGYGRILVGSRSDGTRQNARAHRVSYLLNCGSIPSGMEVLHKCDNPPCVRPDHLFLGTVDDNMKDMVAKKRAANQAGERNGFAKLTEDAVTAIRLAARDGESRGALARAYHVSESCIRAIVTNKRWAHVATPTQARGGGA
jgi:hypothetical protein